MQQTARRIINNNFKKSLKTGMQKQTEVVSLVRKTTENAKQRFFKAGSLVQAEKTKFDVVHQKDIVTLRYYPPLEEDSIVVADGKGGFNTLVVEKETHAVPLVLVAPLAVNMYIYDLFADRSLVKYLRARGFELYLVDWGRPGWRQNHFSFETYITELLPEMISKVREHCGKTKLSLHGWSLGGLFSACYASMDKDIENVALIGAPCDYHANGELGVHYQRISKNLRWLEKRTGWRVHNTPQRWWRSPGWANSVAFKLTNPVGSIQGYLDLLRNLHDEEYVISHATNGAFLDDMVAYPGAIMQDVVQFLLTDNVLAKGELPFRNSRGQFSDVTANLFMVCGKQDPVVTPDCGAKLLELVSSKETRLELVPGGHMGILSGSKSPAEIWPMVADWLVERS
ncbi:alpha/beta fold hydrolase [Litoribacillus peritrichatus]|uniref:Alpha/beta fold hydrolase n=1 Tax=Litoribacillus peritrichatus TaxID=718191 RepID=A0ABP7N288_9GAMM